MAKLGGLLRLGVSQYPTFNSRRVFEVGGLGRVTSVRPFDLEQAPVVAVFTRPFDILGPVLSLSTRPFDVLGPLMLMSTRPFDIVEYIVNPVPGTYVPPSAPVTSGLAVSASAGDTSIQVTGGTFTIGQIINIGGEYRNVSGVSGATVSFVVPLGADHTA